MESSVAVVQQMDVVRNYLTLSREFQEQQFYGKAEETLLLALEKFPNHPLILARLSNLYIQLDMSDRALETLQVLIRANSNLSFPYFLRGMLFEERGEQRRAMSDYQRALQGNKKDIAVLKKLLPLMIANQQIPEALSEIHHYQKLLRMPCLFAELEAEALMAMGQHSPAFNKMREALLHEPSDAFKLKRYLQFSILNSKRSPREVYHILRMSLPGLMTLQEEELDELEIDFFVQHQYYDKARAVIDKCRMHEPHHFLWRKKEAFLELSLHQIDRAIQQLKHLFQEKPSDPEIRNILEEYYRNNDRLNEWIEVVSGVLRNSTNGISLYAYLRSLVGKQDWLGICELSFDEFMKQVEGLNVVKSNIRDVTYEKLPAYALETFVSHLAIREKIPESAELWKRIYKERQKKNQIPPFQVEDLEAAYPVWLFAIHIYFLFKSYTDYEVCFLPGLFQNEQVAAILRDADGVIEVDISNLLSSQKRRLKPLRKVNRGLRWRWQQEEIQPELMLHEIYFYSAEQFQNILKQLENVVSP